MKQALILCGGKASRLYPYSHILPKASLPFLNLPLLSLSWFYLEKLGVSRFLINSHLFTDKLKKTLCFLSRGEQQADVFFEPEPLGGAGTLYKLKKTLRKENSFFYINGDSLFFPSDKKQLSCFKKDFLKTKVDGSFFVSPLPYSNSSLQALWYDKNLSLRFVGYKKDLPSKHDDLFPSYFSGLALFNTHLLETLNRNSFDLFKNFISPLLKKGNFKVFMDKKCLVWEGGEKNSYLKAVKWSLQSLFENKNKTLKVALLEYFSRFDPEDHLVGFKNGKVWSQKMDFPLLAPENVQGLENLTLEGGAVLGPGVCLSGKSLLKTAVLGPQVVWKGSLKEDLLLKPLPSCTPEKANFF